MGGAEILLLGSIGGEVVEGPVVGSGTAGDDFPVADGQSAIVFVVEVEEVALDGGVGGQVGNEAASGQRDIGRVGKSGQVEQCGNDIDQVGGAVSELTVGGDALRPVQDAGRGDAALVDPGFVEAERGVGGAGPTGAEAQVALGGTGC